MADERAEFPPVPRALQWRLVTLGPVERAADAAFVFEVYQQDPPNLSRLPLDVERFDREVLASPDDQAVVRVGGPTGPRVGYFRADGLDPSAGHVQVSVAVLPPWQGRRIVSAAGVQYVARLWSLWPLRKVYFHVPAFRWERWRMLEVLGAVEEGLLHRAVYHEGKRWDLRILALYRTHWDALVTDAGTEGHGRGTASGSAQERRTWSTRCRAGLKVPSESVFRAQLDAVAPPGLLPAAGPIGAGDLSRVELAWLSVFLEATYGVRLRSVELAGLTVAAAHARVVAECAARHVAGG